MGESRTERDRLFSVVPNERRANRYKLKFHTDIRKNISYCEDGQTLEKIALRGGGLPILGDTQNTTRQGPEQPAQVDPAFSKVLDWMISRDAF